MASESPSGVREGTPVAERRRRPFRAATGIAFLAGIAVIVLMGLLSYRTTTLLIENESWISHTQDVISDLDELSYRMERTESTQGRYIITGDTTFLDAFKDDTRAVKTLEQRLFQLTSDNDAQQQRLRELDRLIGLKLSHMNAMVDERRASGLNPTVQQHIAQEGKRLMSDVQMKIAEISRAESQLLTTRTTTQRQNAAKSLRSIVVGGALALIFLALAGVVLQSDIRKRKAIEVLLQRTTALQRAVLNSANYAIMSTDQHGTILTFNAAAERLFGYHSSEVIGQLTPTALHDAAELERNAKQLSRFFGQPIEAGFEALVGKARLGTTDESEWTYTRRDGSHFDGMLSASAMHDEDGSISGYVFIVGDITQRKEAERSKQQTERRYRALLQNSSDIVMVIDPSGRVQYMSPAVERLLGFPVQDLIGREIYDLVHSGDAEAAREALRDISTHSGYSTPREIRLRKVDGETVITEIVGNNLLHDEVLHGIVLNARNISERKRAQSQLEVQNAVARVLAEAVNLDQSIPEILQVLCNNLDWELSEFWSVDPEKNVLTFSYAWSLPGFDLRDFFNISQHTQIHRGEGLAGRVWARATAIQVADISHEENFVRRTEITALSLKTAVGFPIRSKEAVIGVFTLFSLRTRHVDDDLLDMLNTVGAQIGQFIARKRAEQQISDNEERYHYLFENSADLILTFAPDGTILHLNAAWPHTLGFPRDELMKMTLLELITPEDRDRGKMILDKALAAGSVDKLELSFRAQDGRQIIVEGSINCRYGDAGVEYCNAIFQDVTKRREVDRMKNEFISVVSHELRTPLTSIRGSLGLLAGGTLRRDPERADRMLDIALKNTERLVRLINDILDIEKIESGKIALDIQPVDAADLVAQATATMNPLAETNQVRLETHALGGTVFADRDRMLQTLTNLLSNAIKFSKPTSTVTVSSEKRGAGLLIRVRDQGRGIPPHKLQTIFERFQQVDASDSRDKGGTGLGLAICRTIVQQHGGAIWVDSTEGKGSEFFVLLPRFQAETSGTLQGKEGNRLLPS